MNSPIAYAPGADGARLAYRFKPGTQPTVVFLGGFRSDMSGTKARYIEQHCEARGRAVLCLDYTGHGASSGRFEEGTVSSWADDVMSVLRHLELSRVLLVGSSMGGWIMTLVARRSGAQVAAMLGIASAPDFTQELLWPRLGEAEREAIARQGAVQIPSSYGDGPYPITRALLDDGKRHLVLTGPIPIDAPVRLVHGMADVDVPWQLSLRLSEQLVSGDVRVELIKGGEHRLSEPAELARIGANLDELYALAKP